MFASQSSKTRFAMLVLYVLVATSTAALPRIVLESSETRVVSCVIEWRVQHGCRISIKWEKCAGSRRFAYDAARLSAHAGSDRGQRGLCGRRMRGLRRGHGPAVWLRERLLSHQ